MRNSCRAALIVLITWSLGGSAARRLDAQVGAAESPRVGADGRPFRALGVRVPGPGAQNAWADARALQDHPSAPPRRSLAAEPSNRPTAQPPSRRAVEWYHLGAGLGVVVLVSLVDDPIRDELQAHRTTFKDDVSGVFRQMGEPEIYGTIGLGTLTVGVITGNDRITRAGGRISGGLLIAAATTTFLKHATGRGRPSHFSDPHRFRPFSGRDSWPSGHATMAFSLAASVSDEIRSTPVTITLYSAATLTGWSRINDNRHWLSDVLAGAAVGITSAKLMNGRWSVLGMSGPRFLLEPERVGVSLDF
jgi:membrane-associated phospholipid phosphatase